MSKDPGLQPFMLKEDESFVEFTQRTTWFDAMTKAMQKHSELMQPWKDDYPQMEYAYPEIPNWDTPGQGGDVPGDKPPGCDSCHFSAMWFDGPNGCEDAQFCVPYGGKFCMDAATDAAYTEFKKTGVAPEGFGDEITRWSSLAAFAAAMATTGISVNQTSGTPQGYAPAGYIRSDRLRKLGQSTVMSNTKKLCESCWLCIGAWDGTWDFTDGDITFRAEITDSYGNRCRDEKTLRCLCCDQPSYTAVTFDDTSTPDTIAAGGSITVYVADGCGPYAWSVSGTGFSLTAATTAGITNTLNLSADGCGVSGRAAFGVVTITDKCGNSANGTIRASDGAWLSQQSCNASCSGGAACVSATCSDPGTGEIISGSTRKLYSPGGNCIYGGRVCSSWNGSGTCLYTSPAGLPVAAWSYFYGGACDCSGTAGSCFMQVFGNYIWGCPP